MSQKEYHDGLAMAFGCLIIVFSLFIIHRFLPSIIWAGIISIATYPMYQRWRYFFKLNDTISAFLFTSILAILLIAPLSWLISIFVKELQWFMGYLQHLNHYGSQTPRFILQIPWVGKELDTYWTKHISEPGDLKYWLSNLHVTLTPVSYYVKAIGFNIFRRSFQAGFTLLCLFFFFRDSERLIDFIHQLGRVGLGHRWVRYAEKLPGALRGTVNGTILVGLGVGVLMGVCYAWVDVPAPGLMGVITACSAMIPFVVPVVIGFIALLLWLNTNVVAAVIVIAWGSIVVFFADHFIKPAMIGGAIQLPFLAVLFGILGGIETLGLLGLFVGPIVMVLCVSLLQEVEEKK